VLRSAVAVAVWDTGPCGRCGFSRGAHGRDTGTNAPGTVVCPSFAERAERLARLSMDPSGAVDDGQLALAHVYATLAVAEAVEFGLLGS